MPQDHIRVRAPPLATWYALLTALDATWQVRDGNPHVTSSLPPLTSSLPPLMPRGRYACCPNDPYPVIKYRVYVRREPGYFIVWTVVPTTIFTLLSFTVFFMSFQVGRAHHVGCNLLMAVTS